MKIPHNLGRIFGSVAVIGLASACPLSAQTKANDAGRWYVGGDAGLAIMQNVGGLKLDGESAPPGFDISFDVGPRMDLNVGYNVTENIAVELEAGFSYNSVSSIGGQSLSGTGISADLWEVPVLVNGIYKYSFNEKWQAYGGLGVGIVASTMDAGQDFLSNPTSTSATDFQLGYQAMLGVKYLINSNWECDLGYKFLGTTSHKWKIEGHTFETDPTYLHSLLLSVTYKF